MVSTGTGAQDGCGAGVQAGANAGAEGAQSHWRAASAGVEVAVGISKGAPVEMATFVTMLGSRTEAGNAATDAMCGAREIMSTDVCYKS
jgi:hypothetical protein